jgi:hypothetical protein
MMPYNSQPPPSKNTKKNVFNYVLWSMELPMNEETDPTKYYNGFQDLAKPSLNLHWLDKKERDMLFQYGFYPDDCAMLLYHFSEYPCQSLRVYYYLQEVYNTACNIFSQRPAQIWCKHQDALRWGIQFRRLHDDRCKHSPSLSQHQAQELVQELETKVTWHKNLKLAQEEEDWELDNMIGHLHSLYVNELEFTILYKLCIHHFLDIAKSIPKPEYKLSM